MSSKGSTDFEYTSEEFKNSFYNFASYNQSMYQTVEEYAETVENKVSDQFYMDSRLAATSIQKMVDAKNQVESLIKDENISLVVHEIEDNEIGAQRTVSFDPSSLDEVVLAYKQLVDRYGLHPVRPEYPESETPSPYGMVDIIAEIGDEINTRQRTFEILADLEPDARELGETPIQQLLEEERPYRRKAENIVARSDLNVNGQS